jgi:hypothetical protein
MIGATQSRLKNVDPASKTGKISSSCVSEEMQMLSRVAAICILLATALALASAQHRPDLAQTLSTISSSVTNGPSNELLRQLTDDIGARLVGSPAYERAAQWAVAIFKEAGPPTSASNNSRCRMPSNEALPTREWLLQPRAR